MLVLIIGLILFGVLLILIEILVTPGFVVGMIGAGFLVAGIYYTYQEYGDGYGQATLIGSALFLLITLVLAFRNGAWNRFAITDVIEGKANNTHEIVVHEGDQGVTISALRPAGTALINDQKIEVHADGEFILANESIEVTRRVQNRIYIKKTNT